MSNLYKLPCSCGKYILINTVQAGNEVTCQCGTKLTVPTLMNIRKLEQAEFQEYQSVLETSSDNNHVLRNNAQNKQYVAFNRKILKTVGVVGLLISIAALVYFLCTPPHPADVVLWKISYKVGDKKIFRDPTPIGERDRMLLTCYDQNLKKIVPLEPKYTDNIVDLYWLVQLSDLLKAGPQLSDNYIEKFEHLQMMYKAKILFSFVFIGVSIALIIIGVLLPEPPGEGEVRRAGKIVKISDLHKKRQKQNNID